jgi:hypothetical protein
VSRFLAPAFLTGMGIWVWHNNKEEATSVVVLPWLDGLVGPDAVAQGRLTWQLLLGLAALMLIVSTIGTIREKMASNGEQS